MGKLGAWRWPRLSADLGPKETTVGTLVAAGLAMKALWKAVAVACVLAMALGGVEPMANRAPAGWTRRRDGNDRSADG